MSGCRSEFERAETGFAFTEKEFEHRCLAAKAAPIPTGDQGLSQTFKCCTSGQFVPKDRGRAGQ